MLAGTAEFTNLRENPRPSFAPEANTGYAITYERQYFALDEDLLAGMVANHNGEMSDDGWLPMNAKINGQLHPTDAGLRRLVRPGCTRVRQLGGNDRRDWSAAGAEHAAG